MTFSFQIVPKKTKGIETLLQLAAKTVLTTPGKDVFAPAYGGGLLGLAGKNLCTDDIGRISADAAYIIRKSEEQIITEQTGKPFPIDDQLRSLTLLSIDFLEDEGALDIRVLVVSEAGESQDISLANQIRFKRKELVYDPNESLLKLSQELMGTDRLIFNYLYGYDGKPQMSVTEVATRLNLPERYVIDLRNKFSVRLKEIQS